MDAGHTRSEISTEWTADDVLDRLDWLDALDEARAEQAAQTRPPPGLPFPGGGPFER